MTKNAKYYALALGAAIALPLTFQAQNPGTCAVSGASCCPSTAAPVTAGAPAAACAVEAATCPVTAASACCDQKPAAAACGEAAGCDAAATCPATQAKAETPVKPGYARVSFQVEGMSCVSCEANLTRVLSRLDGVESPKVCVQTKVARLDFDPKKVKDTLLVAAIERAGYTVKSGTVQVKVDGLACGDCSTQLTRALAWLDGVVGEQKVCHVAKLAAVTFDPKKLSREKILAAIDQTGFKTVQ